MYTKAIYQRTGITRNIGTEGETIEQKVERVTTNKEPIKDGAPVVYTDRKDGVLPGYNIKTDRFEIALEAMDKVHASNKAKRENVAKMEVVKDGGAEPTQATN